MKTICNGQWRNFKHRSEIPAAILESDFNHLGVDVFDGFLTYRGMTFHISDFTVLDKGDNWHGAYPLTAFESVVIYVSNDGEQYSIGRRIQ